MFITLALRILRKQAGYAAINVAGLGVGLACCLLIYLFIHDELGFDRFHEHADRIYRLERLVTRPGNQGRFAFTSGPAGPALVRDVPEVERAVRFFRVESLLRRGTTQVFGEQVAFVDSTFFKVFSFPLLRGDPATALAGPNRIVLTASRAKRYFGDADPVGQTVRLDNESDYEVTGVVADVPANSHYRFDALASFTTLLPRYPWLESAGGIGVQTYVLLREGTQAEALNDKLGAFIRTLKGPDVEETYVLRPLTRIHLYSDVYEVTPQGDIRTVTLYGAIALVILLLAGINYTNLATARALRRAREVGVRKAAGATRRQLVLQFLGESVLTTALALLPALVLAGLALPALNGFLDRDLSLRVLAQGHHPLMLVGFVLVLAGLAGAYPALYLSRFRPSVVLKGTHAAGPRGPVLRRILVVTQFAASIALLIATTVVALQLRYLQHKDLGFNKDHVVNIPLRDARLLGQADVLQERLRNDPQVADATVTSSGVGEFMRSTMIGPADSDVRAMTGLVWIDPSFLPTLDIPVVAGRNFGWDRAPESDNDVLLNETAARSYGWADPADAIGRRIQGSGWEGTVLGVAADFNVRSLRAPVPPVVLINGRLSDDALLSVRLRPGDAQAAIDRFAALWRDVVPDWPFDFQFLDTELDQQYRKDRQTGRLFGIFAGLAVLIACLGLLGLAAYTAALRTREIGVRKVLGATVVQLVALLSREFTRLVLVAFFVAIPIAYALMRNWLDGFTYRIPMPWWVFPAAGGLALLAAWLTVGTQAVRAARADPVRALRHE